MALIYIDTNVYLDLYQAATDRLTIFKEIEKYSKNVVVTRQTIDEFLRNRVARLESLIKEVKGSVSGGIYTTTVVREMPEYTEIDKLQKEIKNEAAKIVKTLQSWIDDGNADPVLVEFTNLLLHSKFYTGSPEAILKAKDRKVLGNPPTSPDKHTIGDELIWETILESIKDHDLIIVSRDRTFTTNVSLLRMEYETATNHKLLFVTKSISEALKSIGEKSPRLEAAEKEVEENTDYDARTLGEKCPVCSGKLVESGFDGPEGDSAWWLSCTSCGKEFFPRAT